MPSVLVRLEGGLGNQLFQYTAGRALALHTGRTLLLDRSPIARQPHGRSYELHAFAIVEQFVAPPELLAIRAAHSPRLPSFMRQAARYISRRSWSVLRDPGTGFDPSIVNLSGNVVLEGGWQYSEYARQIAPQLRRDLAPRFSMSPKLATVAQAIHESQSVCLHVRRGDYITDPHVHAVHGVQPPDYFNAAAQLLANRLREPVFFVFSEDLDWAESHLSIPGKAWFVRESAGLPPYEDHRLMSGCNHFIISNSTYSWWAAWLGADPTKTVVAPKQWFTAAPTPPGLIPPEWITI